MIALDTNVLLRFLVDDNGEQTARARDLLRRAQDQGVPCFVSDVVLCEVVWVLQRRFRVSRAELVAVLKQLVRASNLVFAARDQVVAALMSFAAGPGGFTDYFIRAQAHAAGCEAVATFDRALLRESGFIAP